MIAPMWTDLYPTGQSSFSTEGTNRYQRYFWNNLPEISNSNNLNSFSLEIRPSGFIGANYTQINTTNQQTWIGTIGDPTLGQWNEIYFGVGVPRTLGNWSVDSTGVDICTTNPLSSPTCPGYTDAMCVTNPLYSTSCSGYQQAYFNQQCTANPLYNVNCPGYAVAYLNYQCSINPLYSTTCEGYETAYFNQQCSLNGLYDRLCPNYAEAYATKMLLEQQGTASTVANAGVIAKSAPKQSEPTTDSTGEVKIAVVTDQAVNNVITTTATSASPAQAATATVPLVVSPQVEAPKPMEKPAPPAEKPQGQQVVPQGQQNQGGEKPQPTARQQLAERRAAAAKKEAVEKGKNLANEMGKIADIETQKQVQNVIIAAMGFTPGFDAYSAVIMKDVVGYKPVVVYGNQKNVDNRNLGFGLYGPSDKLHKEIVESQYNRGN
jgi:hypothetical protein